VAIITVKSSGGDATTLLDALSLLPSTLTEQTIIEIYNSHTFSGSGTISVTTTPTNNLIIRGMGTTYPIITIESASYFLDITSNDIIIENLKVLQPLKYGKRIRVNSNDCLLRRLFLEDVLKSTNLPVFETLLSCNKW